MWIQKSTHPFISVYCLPLSLHDVVSNGWCMMLWCSDSINLYIFLFKMYKFYWKFITTTTTLNTNLACIIYVCMRVHQKINLFIFSHFTPFFAISSNLNLIFNNKSVIHHFLFRVIYLRIDVCVLDTWHAIHNQPHLHSCGCEWVSYMRHITVHTTKSPRNFRYVNWKSNHLYPISRYESTTALQITQETFVISWY